MSAIVFTGLATLFLAFDTVLKVLRLGPAVEGTTALGYPADTVHWIGIIELVCLVLYLVPRTSVLGGAPADRVPGRCDCHPRAHLQPVVDPHAFPRLRSPAALGRTVSTRETAAGPRATAALVRKESAMSFEAYCAT